MIDPISPLGRYHWLESLNGQGSEIPGFALVRISAVDTSGVLTVAQPSADGQDCYIAGPLPIVTAGYGLVTRSEPVYALYDEADGTPALGEVWGAGASSYKLKKGKPGFVIHGGHVDGRVLVRRCRITVRQNNAGTGVGPRSQLDFLDTDTVEFTVADDPTNGEINIQAKATGKQRITETTIPAGTYHDYTIPANTDLWIITPTGHVVITGFVAEAGRKVEIRNAAAAPASGAAPSTITLPHQHGGSTAANRHYHPDAAPLNHEPGETICLKYATPDARWTPAERPPQASLPGMGLLGGGSPGPSMPPNPQTGTTYTPTRTDIGGLITRTNSGSMSDTIPIYPSGWYTDYQNLGPGTLTLTPASGTINGESTMTLGPGQGARIASDGTNLSAQKGGSATGSKIEETGSAGDSPEYTLWEISRPNGMIGHVAIKATTGQDLAVGAQWVDVWGNTHTLTAGTLGGLSKSYNIGSREPDDQPWGGGGPVVTFRLTGFSANLGSPAPYAIKGIVLSA